MLDGGMSIRQTRELKGYKSVSWSHSSLNDHPFQAETQAVVLRQAWELPVDTAFGILGRTSLRIEGRVYDNWGTPRERAVLAALLANAGRSLSIDALIEWAWTEETPIPRSPVPTFHTYATRIRRSLERAAGTVKLLSEQGNYRLEVDRSEIDYYRFRSLAADARTLLRNGDAQRALTLSSQGIRLWRGLPLADLRTSRADNWRHRVLNNEWIPANAVLLEAMLELGDADGALSRIDDLQAEHPNAVELIKLRLRTLHRMARFGDATAYYLSSRQRLVREADGQAADHLRQFHDELTGSAPHIVNGPVVPRQLPPSTADFVGRQDLLAALNAASTSSSGQITPGVIIVDGMPGVGKTALAIQWARRARHRIPDGDLYVNLAGFSGEDKVSQATVIDDFLNALGHPPDASVDRRSRELLLSRLLANRRTLVVLDNVRDTAHVKDLIPLLADSLVIATSRQRLSALSTVTGARRVRVEPMTNAEALELLSRRLGRRQHIGQEHRARIVRLCGGLPLAISVLAEHVMSWTNTQLAEFADQLDRRQLILRVGEVGDIPANPRTFFMWSYDALAGADRRLFRLLALHPGPDFDVNVACACDGRTREETIATLGTLVGAHLVEQPDAFNRYRFHDLLRVFAEHCAEADEPPDGRRAAELRMISFYLASAIGADRILYPAHLSAPEVPVEQGVEPIAFDEPVAAKGWFGRERTNLTAAVRRASARGHHDHAWRLADAVATFFDRHGFYDNSLVVRELAVATTRIAGLREWEASAQVGLGMVLMILGEHQRAWESLTAALRVVEEENNERGQASTLHQLARLEMSRGDLIAAIGLFRRCLDIGQRIDDHEVLCWSHCRIGEALRLTEQHDQALVHLHQALWFAKKIGEQSAVARSLAEIGMAYRDQDNHQAAAAHCEQALTIAESIPDLAVSAEVCIALAEIKAASGDVASGLRYAHRAVTVCRQIQNVTNEAKALDVLGALRFASGDLDDSRTAWRDAADIYDRTGNPRRASLIQAKLNQLPGHDVDVPRARPGMGLSLDHGQGLHIDQYRSDELT
jgi:tetratricopeptide (TPR) repeat protein/DNA-binding SARP family transcriptional activator